MLKTVLAHLLLKSRKKPTNGGAASLPLHPQPPSLSILPDPPVTPSLTLVKNSEPDLSPETLKKLLEEAYTAYMVLGMTNIANKSVEERCEISKAFARAENNYYRILAKVMGDSNGTESGY